MQEEQLRSRQCRRIDRGALAQGGKRREDAHPQHHRQQQKRRRAQQRGAHLAARRGRGPDAEVRRRQPGVLGEAVDGQGRATGEQDGEHGVERAQPSRAPSA